MQIKTLSASLAGLLLATGSMAASAQTITIGQASVPSASGGSAVITISYDDNGNTNVGAYNTVIDYSTLTGPPNYLGGAPVASYSGGAGLGGCTVDAPPATTISLTRVNTSALPDETVCTVTFSVNAGTPAASYALAHDPAPASTAFFDLSNVAIPGTVVDGAVNVVNVGPPTVNIAPPGNPVVLAGGAGTFGSATSATAVPVTLTSLSGAGTASYTCTGTGTTAPFSFAPASGGPFSNGAPDPTDISVSCTRGAAVVTGNVSCARTGGATTPVTFAVECPAGTQTMPTLGANPVGGSTLNGAAAPLGGQSCSTVTITPTGGVGVTPATLTCTVGAGLTVTPAGAMNFLPGDPPATVQVCATTTNAPQSFPIGSGLDCNGADGTGNVQFRYAVEIPAGSLAPPPTNVPASSLWSKLALFGLFGALGMLILGLRRSH